MNPQHVDDCFFRLVWVGLSWSESTWVGLSCGFQHRLGSTGDVKHSQVTHITLRSTSRAAEVRESQQLRVAVIHPQWKVPKFWQYHPLITNQLWWPREVTPSKTRPWPIVTWLFTLYHYGVHIHQLWPSSVQWVMVSSPLLSARRDLHGLYTITLWIYTKHQFTLRRSRNIKMIYFIFCA